LSTAAYSDARWLERLVEEPLLLRIPLVRFQQRLTVGPAEATWREWMER
jgi:arsenate reductase-like glutaredoxin family protein